MEVKMIDDNISRGAFSSINNKGFRTKSPSQKIPFGELFRQSVEQDKAAKKQSDKLKRSLNVNTPSDEKPIDDLILSDLHDSIKNDDGFAMESAATVVIFLGMALTASQGAANYNKIISDEKNTQYKVTTIQTALNNYYKENGAYPCPARNELSVDDDEFGKPLCASAEFGFKTRMMHYKKPVSPSVEAEFISTLNPSRWGGNSVYDYNDYGMTQGWQELYKGTIPTLALGLPKEYAVDEWNNKLFYFVPASSVDKDIINVTTSGLFLISNVTNKTFPPFGHNSNSTYYGEINSENNINKSDLLYLLGSYGKTRLGAYRQTAGTARNTYLLKSSSPLTKYDRDCNDFLSYTSAPETGAADLLSCIEDGEDFDDCWYDSGLGNYHSNQSCNHNPCSKLNDLVAISGDIYASCRSSGKFHSTCSRITDDWSGELSECNANVINSNAVWDESKLGYGVFYRTEHSYMQCDLNSRIIAPSEANSMLFHQPMDYYEDKKSQCDHIIVSVNHDDL